MSVKLTTEYKDHTISFDGNFYTITHDGVKVSTRCKSLEACITWIDKKSKVKYKSLEVLFEDPWNETFIKAIATSLTEGFNGNVVCTYLEGKRANERRHFNQSEVYELSEENLTAIAQLQDIEKQRAELWRQYMEVKRSLKTLETSKLIVEE